jgi:hypothetical protein
MIQDSTFLKNLSNDEMRAEFTAALITAREEILNDRQSNAVHAVAYLTDLIERADACEEYPYKDNLDDLEQYLTASTFAAKALFSVQRACVIYYHNSNKLK